MGVLNKDELIAGGFNSAANEWADSNNISYKGPITTSFKNIETITRLSFNGSGTATFDVRNIDNSISSAFTTITASSAINLVQYPWFGDNAVSIRATYTGNLTAEVI